MNSLQMFTMKTIKRRAGKKRRSRKPYRLLYYYSTGLLMVLSSLFIDFDDNAYTF